jgi:hypothetical protein
MLDTRFSQSVESACLIKNFPDIYGITAPTHLPDHRPAKPFGLSPALRGIAMSTRNTTDNGRSSREDREVALERPTREAEPSRALVPARSKTGLSPRFGHRPVEPSHLNLVESSTLPGKRPVSASTMKLSGTVSAYGTRPISATEINVVQTIALSGNRPVTASSIELVSNGTLPGNRPVASNDLGEESNLMGYLD